MPQRLALGEPLRTKCLPRLCRRADQELDERLAKEAEGK